MGQERWAFIVRCALGGKLREIRPVRGSDIYPILISLLAGVIDQAPLCATHKQEKGSGSARAHPRPRPTEPGALFRFGPQPAARAGAGTKGPRRPRTHQISGPCANGGLGFAWRSIVGRQVGGSGIIQEKILLSRKLELDEVSFILDA